MASNYETFWEHQTYAVVGHSEKRPFPKLTYGALKKSGKRAFAVDPSSTTIEGDKSYSGLEALPEAVEGVVLEVPKDETAAWIERAAKAGVKDVWIHMNTDSPEALEAASKHGMNVRHGTCAVMYLSSGFSPHTIHGFFRKMAGTY